MKWESKGKKKKYGLKRLSKSFIYATHGIISAYKTEQNLIVHTIALIINIVLMIVLKLNMIECALIVIAITIVFALEMVNTAIEYAIDMAMPQIHPLAKISKDVSSGAVLISAIGACVVGLIIYLPKIIELFK